MIVSHAKVVGFLAEISEEKQKINLAGNWWCWAMAISRRGGGKSRLVRLLSCQFPPQRVEMWHRGQEYVLSDISISCSTSKVLTFNSFLQIDMSKCMVSFIDWYLLRINASEREKIKVRPVDYFKNTCWNLKCILILFFNCLKSPK